MRAVLRRVSETGPVAASCAEEGIFTFDRLRIDRAAHRVTLEDGREAGLTSFAQIAALSEDDIAAIDTIKIKPEWVEQAKQLAKG